jgi:recombinational DNA repair ATPase RecF
VDTIRSSGRSLLTWQDIAAAARALPIDQRELLLEIVEDRGFSEAGAVTTGEGPWYLRSIHVRGHIGVGQDPVDLPLTPVPGLTIVSARNGTGKTSIADAVRHNLSGGTTRSYEVLAENVHFPERDVVVTVSNGVREVQILCGRDEMVRWREPGGGLSAPPSDWTAAFARYMPVLLYPEVSRVIQDPGTLHTFLRDALELTVLQELQAALKPMREAGRSAQRTVALAHEHAYDGVSRVGHQELSALLAECGPTAEDSAVDQIHAIIAGLPDSAPPAPVLPDLWAVDDARRNRATAALERLAAARDSSIAGADAVRDALTTLLAQQASLLADNRLHDVCPVCRAQGRGWQKLAADEAARLSGLTKELGEAEAMAAKALKEVIAALPVALVDPARRLLGAVGDPGVDTRIAQWDSLVGRGMRLSAATVSADALASLLDEAADLAIWYAPIRERILLQRDELVAAQATVRTHVQTWLDALAKARPALARLQVATRLNDRVDRWLRTARTDIFEPIGEQVKRLWTVLNPDADLKLTDISLRGGTQRQMGVSLGLADGGVVLPSGRNSSALLSTGQRNALSLATYLPRATQPQSPFGFLVLDDPIHAFDTWRVRYLADYLVRLSKRFQVVVFTHDDRLWQALRALNARPTHIRMDRRADRRPQVKVSTVESPGIHLLNDLQRVLAGEGRTAIGSAEAVTSMALAMCRQALDTELVIQIEILGRRLQIPQATVQEDLRRAKRTADQLGLLNSYAQRVGLPQVSVQPYASTVEALNGGAHGSHPLGDLRQWMRDSRKLIDAIARIGG